MNSTTGIPLPQASDDRSEPVRCSAGLGCVTAASGMERAERSGGTLRPYYDHAGVTIYHGDSREIVPRLGRFPLLLTDPPYGIGKESWDETYPEWASELFFEAADSVCVIPGIWALGKCIADMGEKYQWTIAGHKSAAMTNGRIGLNKWQPAVLGGKVKRIGQDAFDFSQVDDGKLGHSCQKPLEFVAWLVWKLSKEGDVILDPFCGSGTTGRAAKDLGRKAVLIDREERYCEMSAKRMAQECLFVGGGGAERQGELLSTAETQPNHRICED